jgi:dipeptidyl aminopeptidase/acylaminoacyl peptidase
VRDPARTPDLAAPARTPDPARGRGPAADLAAAARDRFLAAEIGGVRWSPVAPDRLAVVSTEGGLRSAWAWDRATGERRRVSDPAAGAEEALVTPDGSAVVWWHDPAGDERGRWMVSPFDGGAARPLLPGLPDAWAAGVSMVARITAAGFATDDAYVVVLAPDGGASIEIARQAEPLGVGREWPQGDGGLSADGRLLCLRDAAGADIAHPALRVVDVADGATVATLADPGRVVEPIAWSPIPGDGRLLVTRETGDRRRPWLWVPAAGTLTEVPLDLPGDVTHGWWYPDAASLLLLHEDRARPSLHRSDLATGSRTTLVDRGGTIEDAGMRPDGRAWYRYDDGSAPPAWLEADGSAAGVPRVVAPGPAAPAGRRWARVSAVDPAGETIDAWLLRPDGPPPYPTILHAHGGPEWRLTDTWDPLALAYADAGYAVVAPNYRGSTGYGAAFRERLRGDPGFPETEDLVACIDRLVADGLADPDRLVLEGWSWGGYLATLGAGLHPDRWRAVVAGIPVGDLVAAHYESAPPLQAWDVAIFGGDPLEVPALYHERNPMTYVDRVAAPVLLIAGERDSRCPLGQVMVYAHALRRRGHPVEVRTYPEGHHALRAEERIAQAELILDFLARSLARD